MQVLRTSTWLRSTMDSSPEMICEYACTAERIIFPLYAIAARLLMTCMIVMGKHALCRRKIQWWLVFPFNILHSVDDDDDDVVFRRLESTPSGQQSMEADEAAEAAAQSLATYMLAPSSIRDVRDESAAGETDESSKVLLEIARDAPQVGMLTLFVCLHGRWVRWMPLGIVALQLIIFVALSVGMQETVHSKVAVLGHEVAAAANATQLRLARQWSTWLNLQSLIELVQELVKDPVAVFFYSSQYVIDHFDLSFYLVQWELDPVAEVGPWHRRLLMSAVGGVYFVQFLCTRIHLSRFAHRLWRSHECGGFRFDGPAMLFDGLVMSGMYESAMYVLNLKLVFYETNPKDMVLNMLALQFVLRLDDEFKAWFFERSLLCDSRFLTELSRVCPQASTLTERLRTSAVCSSRFLLLLLCLYLSWQAAVFWLCAIYNSVLAMLVFGPLCKP
jgi:hypothetical protein